MDAKTQDHKRIVTIEKAVEALRKRLGENAVRYLCKREGCDPGQSNHLQHLIADIQEFVQMTELRAGNAEEFAVAMTKAAAQHAPHWYGDASAPLPDDLKVLALEYQYLQEDNDDVFGTLFRALGLCSEHKPGEITLFGKSDKTRLRVDAVMTSKDYWTRVHDVSTTSFDFLRRNGLALVHCKLVDSFAHRYEVGDEFLDWDWFEAAGSSRFDIGDFEVNLERPGEFKRWALAAAERTKQWMALRNACNGNFKEMLKVLDPEQSTGTQQFIVDGVIPRGVVTLLLARKGVGKTNAALELAVAVAERRDSWWGFKLRPGDGFVVFLLGEGSREEATERVLAMNNGKWPIYLKLEKYNESTLIEDVIAKLKDGIKVDLLIVDPARKYYRGDEDGSDAVSTFFTQVESFADANKAGLIVAHHLKRDANPKNIHDVPKWLRGSQVWLDRPRVITAMHRRGSETTFGIPVRDGDPLHNLRASAMFSGVLKLQRDEDTFTHVPVGGGKKPTSKKKVEQVDEPTDDVTEPTITRLLDEGKRIGTSSKYELFSYKPKELEGMSRSQVRAAVERLIKSGRVLRDADGRLHLPRMH